MKKYKKLNILEVRELSAGDLVFITSEAEVLYRASALVSLSPKEDTIRVVTSGLSVYNFEFAELGNSWTVEVEHGFTVETPDGILHAYDKGDPEYPGVMVDLYRSNNADANIGIGLAMTEYVPGDEALCSYGPVAEMESEIGEVPTERIVYEDGTPILSFERSNIVHVSNKCRVTSGLVTRVWPDEVHNEETHKRVFHYGYNSED